MIRKDYPETFYIVARRFAKPKFAGGSNPPMWSFDVHGSQKTHDNWNMSPDSFTPDEGDIEQRVFAVPAAELEKFLTTAMLADGHTSAVDGFHNPGMEEN